MALKKLLIFTDYTAASDMAAQHCYQLASLAGSEIVSLHVISSDEDIEWAEQKCVEQAKRLQNYDGNIPFIPIASAQSLFRGMNKWLHQQGVNLAFMATHGKKDLQFVTGSNALKLIFSAEAPILVVQQQTVLRPYNHILLPVFSHQSGMIFPMDELKAVVSLFNSSVTFITPAANEASEIEAMERTIHELSLSLKGIASNIAVKASDLNGKKFSVAVAASAEELRADLIAVLIGAKHHRKEAERIKKFYQTVITNDAGFPVLCL